MNQKLKQQKQERNRLKRQKKQKQNKQKNFKEELKERKQKKEEEQENKKVKINREVSNRITQRMIDQIEEKSWLDIFNFRRKKGEYSRKNRGKGKEKEEK